MAPRYGIGSFSNKYKTFIIVWTFLHNVSVYFGGYLILLYYCKTKHDAIENSFQLSNLDYWLVSGCVFGGLSSLVLGKSLGTRALLLLIRCVQFLAIIIILVLYILQKYNWAENYWLFGVYPTFMLQGFIDCMSQISSPIYIMETICDRGVQLPVILLLLISTQLPLYMSSFIAVLLSKHHMFLTLGVGIFGGVFILVVLLFIFLPNSSQDGTVCAEDENASYWHLQKEKELGWLCPATSSIAISILSQMTGFQMYEFYAAWSVRLVCLTIDTKLVNSGIPFITLLLTIPFWCKNRIPFFLVSTTGVMSVCLLMSGIVLHGLEAGNSIYPQVPFILNIIFDVSYSAGLLSLAPIVCIMLTPRKYRLTIFSLVITLTTLDRRLVRSVTPTFIELLHPFGVFWLHAGATSLGLLYIVVAIMDQVKDVYRCLPPSRCTVEEFITQV